MTTPTWHTRWDRFISRAAVVAFGLFLFIWTVSIALEEHADHYFGYDLDTLRPIDALVASFSDIVHSNDPDRPVREFKTSKWVRPVVVSFIGSFPEWHQEVLLKHLALMHVLTGLDVTVVSPDDPSANLKVHFLGDSGVKAILEAGRKIGFGDFWDEDFIGNHRCFALLSRNHREEITSGVNLIARTARNSKTQRCMIEELTQVFGLTADNATYRPSVFSNRYLPVDLSINDKILVRTLYDPRIKPGMTRRETEPLAREIIGELVAAVKARGVTALYQR